MAVMVAAVPAEAQPKGCAPYDEVIANAEKRFGETSIGIALAQDGRLLEILINPDTGSVSVIKSDPNGPTCVVDAAEFWQPAKSSVLELQRPPRDVDGRQQNRPPLRVRIIGGREV